MEWEPTPDDTMAAIAEREGRPAQEVVYDFLTEGDGRNLVMFPFTNYFHFSLDDVHDMLEHPASVWGLGDGGAHCGAAVDASGPTLMLTHWVRDRTRGPRDRPADRGPVDDVRHRRPLRAARPRARSRPASAPTST